MKDLDSEPDVDMTRGSIRCNPQRARYQRQNLEPGAGAAGVRKATYRHPWSPPGGRISVV